MIKINSPEGLSKFIGEYSGGKIVKSLGEYDDSIVIRLHLMDPKGYDMAIYEVKLAGMSKLVVVKSVKESYNGLNVPEMSPRERRKWNAHVPIDMII